MIGKNARLILAYCDLWNAEQLPTSWQQRQAFNVAVNGRLSVPIAAARHVQENNEAMVRMGKHDTKSPATIAERSGGLGFQASGDQHRSIDVSLPIHRLERLI